jgi:hypothetical protein
MFNTSSLFRAASHVAGGRQLDASKRQISAGPLEPTWLTFGLNVHAMSHFAKSFEQRIGKVQEARSPTNSERSGIFFFAARQLRLYVILKDYGGKKKTTKGSDSCGTKAGVYLCSFL